jgi:hypothetical protein
MASGTTSKGRRFLGDPLVMAVAWVRGLVLCAWCSGSCVVVMMLVNVANSVGR